MAMARASQEASPKPIWLWACFFVVYWCAFAASSNWWLWCNPRNCVLNQVNKDIFCGHGKGQPRSKPSANLALGLLFLLRCGVLLLLLPIGGLGATPKKVSLIR